MHVPVELDGSRGLEPTFHQYAECLEKVDGTSAIVISSRRAAGHQVASANGVHVRTEDRHRAIGVNTAWDLRDNRVLQP